jgi:hypothetical protein
VFKIIDYRNSSGKILVTIETDDATSALMLRFLSAVDKFAELFHYRVSTESRLTASQKTFPEKMVRARSFRADLLRRYRELLGSRLQRLRILKELCIVGGVVITQDRLSAALQIALEEEREGKLISIKKLILKGKSISDIATALDLPKSTVARFARSLRGASKRDARVKRTVLALADRPPGPVPSSSLGRNPASIPPGRPKTA